MILQSLRLTAALFLLFCLRAFAADPDPFTYGKPGGTCAIVDKQYFVICHSSEWRTPAWVAFRLTPELLEGGAERTNRFFAEPAVPREDRAELADYRKSGYDRGHMAPASSFKRSKDAMAATFSLANMVPQTPANNRGAWRMIEDCIRELAKAHGNVYVFAGPLNLGPDHKPIKWLNGRVAAPSHTFQVVFCDHDRDENDEFFAFITPNAKSFPAAANPADFYFSVHDIETFTGLEFFSEARHCARLKGQAKALPSEAFHWRPPVR